MNRFLPQGGRPQPGGGPPMIPERPPEVVTPPYYYHPAYDEGAAGGGLVEYWRLAWRNRWTLATAAVLGALMGFLYTTPQTPIYQASTTVEVQGLNENFLNMGSYSPTTPGYSYDPTYDITTQIKLMESSAVKKRAMERLLKQRGPEYRYPPDRLSAWKQALGMAPKEPVSREEAIAAAAGSVTVKASGTTRILEVTCDSPDPRLAADFANALVAEFIEESLDSRWRTTAKTAEYLTKQLEDLKIKLEKSEDELQAYASAVGLQLTGSDEKGGKENVAEERFRALQSELLKAQAERMAAQSKYEMANSSPPEALPQVLDDATLREYQSKLVDLRRQLAELSTTLMPANPKVQKVQAQIDEIEAALRREQSNVVRRLGNDYQAALRREQLLLAEANVQSRLVSVQAAKAVHYNILKREVDTNRQLYESMLQKVKEAGIASAMRASTYRVVDAATPPERPYRPRPARMAFFGLLGGLVLGFGFVIVRERADRTLQQPGDLTFYLNLPELGVIPSGRSAVAKLGPRGPAGLIPGQSADGDKLELVTWKRKPSLIAESFRATLTSILLSGQNGERPRVIALTSAGPSEGKTTAASNLAIALAETNRRVLLVDADMRRPRLHDVFELPNEEGLSTLLQEKAPLKGRELPAAVQETEVPGLFVLPSGPPSAHASNLMYSPRLPELIELFREEFDTVLIDTPPMLHLADTRLLARYCDTVILVVRAGRTSRDTALAARQRFMEDGTPILGTILVDWSPGRHGVGYGSKYYDGYSKYYGGKRG